MDTEVHDSIWTFLGVDTEKRKNGSVSAIGFLLGNGKWTLPIFKRLNRFITTEERWIIFKYFGYCASSTERMIYVFDNRRYFRGFIVEQTKNFRSRNEISLSGIEHRKSCAYTDKWRRGRSCLRNFQRSDVDFLSTNSPSSVTTPTLVM